MGGHDMSRALTAVTVSQVDAYTHTHRSAHIKRVWCFVYYHLYID